MDFEKARSIILQVFNQTKDHQVNTLVRWLDGALGKHRESYSGSMSNSVKINPGQRFVCPCGRSFSTEMTIRETTNVDGTSPPATPLILMKNDFKLQQHSSEPMSKRSRMIANEPNPSTLVNINGQSANLIDRLNSGGFVGSWSVNTIKTYENSPELLTVESNRAESDIELSSDESRCLEDIDNVLSPDKTTMSSFIYSNDLWTNASLSGANNHNLTDSSHQHQQQQQQQQQHQQQHHHQQQMITLKPVNNEPLSPVPGLVHDSDMTKTVATIHRRPMLIAFNDSEACSPTTTKHFKCNQCHEIFDSLILGQEHANNGMCTPDATVHTMESSDSQPSPSSSALFDSYHEELEETTPPRVDTKAACPICNKGFSSVHTMIRHKTSIHDRQVRYECNICGRVFFRKDKLTSHMVYHQDVDTYVCCVCSLGFKSRMLMRQHLKRDHIIPGEDARLNEILTRCQVKKSLNVETNMSVAYGTDRTIAPSKRTLNCLTNETDIKQGNTSSNN